MVSQTFGIVKLSSLTGHNRVTLHRWAVNGKIPSNLIALRIKGQGRGKGWKFYANDKMRKWITIHRKIAEDYGLPGKPLPNHIVRKIRKNLEFATLAESVSDLVPKLVALEMKVLSFPKIARRLRSNSAKQNFVEQLESTSRALKFAANEIKKTLK